MKFVSLALTLLLAVGSHAAAMPQADAPSQLAHMRAVLDMALTNARDAAKRSVTHLDDADYRELKEKLNEKIDEAYNGIKGLQQSVAPLTDSVVSTVGDAITPVRETIRADIDLLRAEMNRGNLREVLNRHLAGYQALLEPIANEMALRHRTEMEATKARLEPVAEQLRTLFLTNAEETKEAMMPLVMSAKAKLEEHLDFIKTQVTPYVDEYKQQALSLIEHIKTMEPSQRTSIRDRLVPIVEEIKAKFGEAAGIITEALQ